MLGVQKQPMAHTESGGLVTLCGTRNSKVSAGKCSLKNGFKDIQGAFENMGKSMSMTETISENLCSMMNEFEMDCVSEIEFQV